MTFDRIHGGLPGDTPWIFRVPLRSRVFLVVTLVVTVLVGVTAASNPEWLLRFDRPASEWIRGSGGEFGFAKFVTRMGSPNLAVGIGVVGVVVLWRWCRASAITLASLIAAAVTTDIVLKIVVDRVRPPSPAVGTALGSFPSGHVIHTVVIYGLVPFLLWVLTSRRALLRIGFAVFVVIVVGVAWSRVRLGAHWPSDVIASFFIGASLLLAAERILTSKWAADHCASLGHHLQPPPLFLRN